MTNQGGGIGHGGGSEVYELYPRFKIVLHYGGGEMVTKEDELYG